MQVRRTLALTPHAGFANKITLQRMANVLTRAFSKGISLPMQALVVP